jgi:hypothetical protein
MTTRRDEDDDHAWGGGACEAASDGVGDRVAPIRERESLQADFHDGAGNYMLQLLLLLLILVFSFLCYYN